jgi:site-specific DNA-adenine methylase
MNVIMQRRAVIALSSLDKKEQEELNRVLKKLEDFSLKEFIDSPLKKEFTSKFFNEKLYVVEGNSNFKIIVSLNEEEKTCTVEDIFSYQRLESFPVFKQAA